MTSFDESHFVIPPISKVEETTVSALSKINIEDQGSTSFFCKRTTAIWNNFKIVMVDRILKIKYKKYVKLYTYTSSRESSHLKRYQKSHMMCDARLWSTLNTQRDNLIGNFAYNYENQKKVLVKWIVKDELSFSLCESFNLKKYVQLALQYAYKRTSRHIFRRVAMTNFLAIK